jgi:hypothetical protein
MASTVLRSIALALAVVASVSVASSCGTRQETLNRVIDPYWRKSDFNPDSQWYVRTTVVDAPPEHGYISIADGDWLMLERVRWEVTETHLVGWRDYPVVPGTELEQYPGGDDIYKGQPVAMFRIVDHFDIRQDFDPTSGELGNQIVENRDRLWFDRAFMRVDWSTNMVPTFKWHIWLNQIFNTFSVVQNDPADPKRYRFELDASGELEYFEVTTRTQVEPDIYSYFDFYGVPYMYDSAGAILDMRHSFMRVPPSDYEALPMPPTVVLEDGEGNEVRDDNGLAVRVPINDRFGFFGTLGRNTFDENRGMVSSGQIFNASRFNIWVAHKNADGTIIPTDQREPKPIIYYTNVEHPENLQAGSQRVAREWNRAFREVIFQLQPTKYTGAPDENGIPADVPEMFIVRRNDCNFDNVNAFMSDLPEDLVAQVTAAAVRESFTPEVVSFDGTVADAKRRFDDAQIESTGTVTERNSLETQAVNDLERVCSALEYFTGGDVTLGRPAPTREDGSAIPQFKYQRIGDTRYSLLNLIAGNFQSGWSGLGPPYSDPISGETISAAANISVPLIDWYVTRALHMIQAMNGDLSPLDLAFGRDVERYMNQKLVETNYLTSLKPGNRAKEEMGLYFDALKQRGGADVMQNAVGEVPEGRARERMEILHGTEIEQGLITDDDLIAFGRVDPLAADAVGGTFDEALLDAVSPLRNNDPIESYEDRQRRVLNMGQRAMDAPEILDNLVFGMALRYRNQPYEEVRKQLREDIYVAIQMHEVGHNVGLMHNMAGSSDALNYGPKFWQMQALNPDMQEAITELTGINDAVSEERIAQLENCIAAVDDIGTDAPGQLDPLALTMTTQDCLGQNEVMFSSIMDYHVNWSGDIAGLGPYDRAAIKFAYGQLLEVFPEDNLRDRAGDTRTMKRKIQLDGWQTIPTEVLTDIDAINERTYQKMEWNTSSTRQAPLPNEVPYKFGYGAQFTPDEKPGDFGPDFRTNARWQLTRYYQHYFFTHFFRDRLFDFFDGFSIARNADVGVMMDFTRKMQWFFFFSATDPQFEGTYAQEDMLSTTILGLNLMGQVLGHPSNGLHVSALKTDVFGLLNEPVENRLLEPSDVMIPWTSMGECSARQVAITDTQDNGTFVAPRAGFNAGTVPPSEGRPFFLGLTDDYEDWFVTYVGTYWSKAAAVQYLTYDYAWFPRFDGNADPRIYDVSWYRLFPRQVSKLYHNLITDQTMDLGPTITPDGEYVTRQLINPEDLSEPDYTGNTRILPSISFNHQYFALAYANVYNSYTDDTFDMPKTMRVALEGGNDDMEAFNNAIAIVENDGDPATNAADVVATFQHPVTGLTLRGLKVGEFPIAYDLVARLNLLKERFEVLNACVQDMDDGDDTTNLHLNESYCHCVSADADLLTGDCRRMLIEPVGSGTCQEYSLRNRRDSAREILDDLVDYVGILRSMNKFFGLY